MMSDTQLDDELMLTADPADVDHDSVAALVGNDDMLGILDRYKVRIVRGDGTVQPFITWHCDKGCGQDGGGTVGVIARDFEMNQTNLTLGELVQAALRHAEEEHGEDYGLGDGQ